MKAGRLAVGSAKIEQIETDRSEEKVGRPPCNPRRDAVALAQGEKEVREKIHRENEKYRSGYAGKNTAARVTDAKRRRNADHHQTGPRQGETILKMRAEWREQSGGEIGIELQILTQLRQTEKFRARIWAVEVKWCFAPVVDLKRRIDLLLENVAGGIVVNHLHLFELPDFPLRLIERDRRQIIGHEIVARILQKQLDTVKRIAAGAKILDEPGARIGSIAKDLSLDQRLWMRMRF